MVAVVAVVAVAALPVILPTMGLVTDKLVKVPTLVKLDPVTEDFNVVPVNCSAEATAVILISSVPSNATPFIFLGIANFVAEAAFPSEFNFKFNSVCMAVDIGLFSSLVLSTLPKPKLALAPTAVVAPVPPSATPNVLLSFPAESAKSA